MWCAVLPVEANAVFLAKFFFPVTEKMFPVGGAYTFFARIAMVFSPVSKDFLAVSNGFFLV